MRVIKSPKMEVRCMNCKNNTKIILLLSIGLLLIPGCHKSATAEDISLTAEDVVLNDPFLTTLFYYSKGTITSDVLQSIKDNEISQEERKTKYESCKNLYQSNFTYLADFIFDNPNKEETMVNSALNIGLSQLMINNDCISVVFRDNINFPIIKGLLYSGWENFSAIATLEDYIKNKQILRENYLENENTNVKLDIILVTGKVESKGYTRPADYNEDVYSLVLRPEAMSGIKVIALAADRESTEIMQEANIGENYRLQCDISGHKHRIIEEGDSKELVYTIKHCNPLTPERFDIKPDQIESVTNYLNGMKQCKRNELYFDGKCLDLSQNSPDTSASTQDTGSKGVRVIQIDVFPPTITWIQNNCYNEDRPTYSATCIENHYGSKKRGCKLSDNDLANLDSSKISMVRDNESCKLHESFIFETDYKMYGLKPGDLFEQANSHERYQILDGISEDAYYDYMCCDGIAFSDLNPCSIHGTAKTNCDPNEHYRIIRVKNVSNSVTSTQSIPSTGEQARVADIPPVPTLIPAPAVTNPPEQRLKFKKSLKTKKGKVEYLIFHDNQLNTDCYISMLQNQEVLNNQHYCIPFSGNLKELVHPLSLTQTAQQFDSYSYCTNISIEKRNIPGLANFFKAFNPSFYEAKLKRFIDNPFQIIKPLNTHKVINNCNGQCSPHEEECYQMFFSTKPGCNLFQAAQEDRLTSEMIYYCKLNNPFITFEQYMQYNLTPGDIFLTASAKKGEKVLHQYWQVFDRTSPELQFDGTPEEIFEGNTCKNQYRYYNTTIVQVKDLSSKDTYDVLHPAILQAMNVRDKYCKAFNNTLINEARAGNYALVDSGSPLLKKK